MGSPRRVTPERDPTAPQSSRIVGGPTVAPSPAVARPEQQVRDQWLPAPEPIVRSALSGGDLATFGAVVRGRRSVRRLLPDPLPDGVLDAIIEDTLWAPSPHGTQPWRFAVMTRETSRAQLADAMAESWRANLALDGDDPAVMAQRLAGSRRRLLEAPALVLVCQWLVDLDRYPDPQRAVAERTMATQSLGAAVQTLLLSTYARGLDAGWMCAPLFCPEVVRDALGLDARLDPQALVAIGYAAADPRRRPRRPPSELIVWDDRVPDVR